MHCKTCNKIITPTDKFCSECGTPRLATRTDTNKQADLKKVEAAWEDGRYAKSMKFTESDCPYQNQELINAWLRGYRAATNNEDTPKKSLLIDSLRALRTLIGAAGAWQILGALIPLVILGTTPNQYEAIKNIEPTLITTLFKATTGTALGMAFYLLGKYINKIHLKKFRSNHPTISKNWLSL